MQALDFRPIPPVWSSAGLAAVERSRLGHRVRPMLFRGAASRAREIPRSLKESAVDAPRGASGDQVRRNRAPQGRRVL